MRAVHHHAHLAARLGEHLWPRDGGRVATIVLDGLGLGLGPDGTIWGGEVLLGDHAGFERRAWLEPAPLPGGDLAQREPWRNAQMRQAVTAGINAPRSSSVGRLFDAVAAILGLCPARQSHEAEAAMALEAQAGRAGAVPPYPMGDGPQIGTAPLFQGICADMQAARPVEEIAARFHVTLAESFAVHARQLVNQGAAEAVVLSGGCFQNALLLDCTLQALLGYRVMTHQSMPANDGSLAFGQALVVLAALD